MGTLSCHSSAGEAVRRPAVAGQFYPAGAAELRRDVEHYLAGGETLSAAPRIVICPHAGYVFSGPVAGKAYAAVDRNIKAVIILGPPHRAPVRGIAVPSCAWFETPLGKVEVDRERIKKLMKNPLAYKDDGAHAQEHSLEVQIPFLQVRLASSFTIVPLLVHGIDPQKAADLLLPLIDDRTLVVASSDFSHYLEQKEARRVDDASIAAVLEGRTDAPLDACGEMPVRVCMALAKKTGLSPVLLDKRTSWETAPQHGSSGQVVGYAAIAYCAAPSAEKTASPAPAEENPAGLSPAVKDFLLKLARQSLEASVRNQRPPEPKDVPEITREDRGCFVTLTIGGELRGCIGYIEPIKPLYRAVIENAENAALADPRFPRVQPGELPSIKVEVSVLTKPVPLPYTDPKDLLSKLEPGVDGLILSSGFRQSTYLPQVWEHFGGDRIRFLESLAMKGGMPPDGWKTAVVKRYRAEHFSEQ